jgi:hypothetical protein
MVLELIGIAGPWFWSIFTFSVAALRRDETRPKRAFLDWKRAYHLWRMRVEKRRQMQGEGPGRRGTPYGAVLPLARRAFPEKTENDFP